VLPIRLGHTSPALVISLHLGAWLGVWYYCSFCIIGAVILSYTLFMFKILGECGEMGGVVHLYTLGLGLSSFSPVMGHTNTFPSLSLSYPYALLDCYVVAGPIVSPRFRHKLANGLRLPVIFVSFLFYCLCIGQILDQSPTAYTTSSWFICLCGRRRRAGIEVVECE